jgi:hypothetical protein
VIESGDTHAAGKALLTQKYPQYRAMPLGDHPLIVITPSRVTSWGKV